MNKYGQGEKLSDERRAKQGAKYANQYDAFRGYHARYFKDERGNPLPVGKIDAKHIIPYVIEYFTQVKAVFDKASGGVPEKSYRIGAYGSGFVLEELTRNNLVDLKWLSMSRGYPGSPEYRISEKWDLVPTIATS